jgi:hypothetical protein
MDGQGKLDDDEIGDFPMSGFQSRLCNHFKQTPKCHLTGPKRLSNWKLHIRLSTSREPTSYTPPKAASHRTWTIRIDPPNGKAAGELVIGNAGKDSSPASRDAVSKNAEVFNLVDVKVATQGHITWAAKREAPAITVLVPPLTRVSTHPGL